MNAVRISSNDNEQLALRICLKCIVVLEPKRLTLGLRQADILGVEVTTLNLIKLRIQMTCAEGA